MNYRKFGNLDWQPSALGFGAMRLPIIGNDRSNVDEAESIRMIRYAIDQGVNYVDTAYGYHQGKSEIVVGKALRDGYRNKVHLATKMPIRSVVSYEDLDRIFGEQLTKLQTDHFDFYLFHGLQREGWKKVKELDALSWAEQQMEAGKIGHLGFSFHDEYTVFQEIVDGYDRWAFCQIQYNYLDNESSPRTPGTEGLKYAASKGLAVVVMEPIQGGNLGVKQPSEIQVIWDKAKLKRSSAEWALQWVWNQPEVSLALSGMTEMLHVVENLKSANRSGPNILTREEQTLISEVRDRSLNYGLIGCTGCRYCSPCPNDVAIPEIMSLFNQHYIMRDDQQMQVELANKYEEISKAGNGAKSCVRCGECESKCPQQLPIRHLLSRASSALERTML